MAYLLTRNSRTEEDLIDQLFNSSGVDQSLLSVSGLGRDHCNNFERAGIHDKNVIAHEDVFIAAVLWSIFEDRSQAVC
jgi:hypothetical protein